MRTAIIRLVIIGAAATAAGLIRANNLPWIPDVEHLKKQAEQHDVLRRTAGVSLERMLELISEGAVIIDSRPADVFEEGHLYLETFPPVLNVPPDAIDANINRLMELLGSPLVLYCTSEECDIAEELFTVLRELGFTDMWIFFPGYAGIREAGLPIDSGPDNWTGFYTEPNVPQPDEVEPNAAESTDPDEPDDANEP